jgi:VIT1/CCC1 family predicted Fe2+/Mn2+ transporter
MLSSVLTNNSALRMFLYNLLSKNLGIISLISFLVRSFKKALGSITSLRFSDFSLSILIELFSIKKKYCVVQLGEGFSDCRRFKITKGQEIKFYQF